MVIDHKRIGNTKPLFRPAAATACLRRRPLLARGEGGVPSRQRRPAAAAPIHITGQGSSWFPLHICGVKPTVSEELQFNQQVCGREAQHTLHTCETPREYCRTSVVPVWSKNSCGFVLVVFQKPAEPFSTMNRACTPFVGL